MSSLLEVKSLTVKYGGEGNIIENINMSVGNREIVGIVGESGSGKTTLIRAIINLLSFGGEIVSGEIIFNGENIITYSRGKWSRIRRSDICMVFQNPGASLNPIKKVGSQFVETIRSHMRISRREAVERAEEVLGKMHFSDIPRIMSSYPFQLSGGMKQRVCIAMAMVLEPKLILADEPTSALDVITQTQIIKELMELRDNFNTSIIIVTHNMGCAAYMADKIVVMNEGKIVEFDYKENIIARPQTEYTKKLLDAVPELEVC